MQIINITLFSKNNKKDNKYCYIGIGKIDNDYFYLTFPVFNTPQRKNTIAGAIATRKVDPKFYKANNINI